MLSDPLVDAARWRHSAALSSPPLPRPLVQTFYTVVQEQICAKFGKEFTFDLKAKVGQDRFRKRTGGAPLSPQTKREVLQPLFRNRAFLRCSASR